MNGDFPTDRRYTETHEWVKLTDGGNYQIGITAYAQESLGDMVHVELPDEGMTVTAGDEVGVIESVNAATDVYSPISGEVLTINEKLISMPDLLNQDPYRDGWLFTVEPKHSHEWEDLMDADAYAEFCETDSYKHAQ